MRPSEPISSLNSRARFDPTSLLPLLVVGAALLAYLNSFQGVFLFDDAVNIVQRERIRQLWPPWPAMSGRRPITDLTLAVNFAIGGLEPLGYHVVNLVIHGLAGLALFGIVRRTLLLDRFADRHQTAAPWLALAVSLIWVVHPLQTQAVTYLVQRAESLMGLFYLLTLYLTIRGATSSRPVRWYIGAVIVSAMGMGSKAVMVTAPVVVLLFDWVFLAPSIRQVVRRRWPLYLGLASTWAVLWLTGLMSGVLDPRKAHATVGFGFEEITPIEYALTQPGVIVRYLMLSIWPAGQCLDYRWPVADAFADIVPPLVLVGVLLSATGWLLLRRRAVGFLGAWFFVVLAPTSSIVPIRDSLFEHRMYLSLASVVVLIVIGAYAAVSRWSTSAGVRAGPRGMLSASLLIVAVICLTAATIRRNAVYHSGETMWRDVAAKRPNNPRAHEHVGTILVRQKRFTEAMAAYREAIRVDPAFTSAYANLANALHETGRLPEAVEQYRKAAELDPWNMVARMNMGDALEQQGLIEEALDAYRSAARITPRRYDAKHKPRALFNYGSALARQAQFEEAAVELREAIALRPDYEKAHFVLGLVALQLERFDEAVKHLEETVRLNPSHPAAPRRLAEAQAAQAREPATP